MAFFDNRSIFNNTVYIGFKPKSGRYIKWIFAWFNDQVVAKANVDYTPLGLTTSKRVDGRYFTIKLRKFEVVIPMVTIM